MSFVLIVCPFVLSGMQLKVSAWFLKTFQQDLSHRSPSCSAASCTYVCCTYSVTILICSIQSKLIKDSAVQVDAVAAIHRAKFKATSRIRVKLTT